MRSLFLLVAGKFVLYQIQRLQKL